MNTKIVNWIDRNISKVNLVTELVQRLENLVLPQRAMAGNGGSLLDMYTCNAPSGSGGGYYGCGPDNTYISGVWFQQRKYTQGYWWDNQYSYRSCIDILTFDLLPTCFDTCTY